MKRVISILTSITTIVATMGMPWAPFMAQTARADATHSIVHSFDIGAGGSGPEYGLTLSDGKFYGVTSSTLFSVNLNGSAYTTLHTFDSFANGNIPTGTPVVFGTKIYGTSKQGGTDDGGILYSIDTDGTDFTVLYEFDYFGGWSQYGALPVGSLAISGSTLYGLTSTGGDNNGVVYSIDTDGTDYTVLHIFTSADDGTPNNYSSLALYGGVLYGTTYSGGENGGGSLFSIATNGTGYSNIASFGTGGTNMSNPVGAPVKSGTMLYGMTFYGGSSDMGTIYALDLSGAPFGPSATPIHSFAGGADGAYPLSSLTLDGSTLYGPTQSGGLGGVDPYDGDNGTLFSMDVSGSGYAVLHSFQGPTGDGSYPYGDLLLSNGTLYGMTKEGGANTSYGTIFSFGPLGGTPAPTPAPLGSAYGYRMDMSSSAPSSGNNLTLTFTTSNPVPAGGFIHIDFPSQFTMNALAFDDMDLSIGGVEQDLGDVSFGSEWGAVVNDHRVTFTSDAATIAPNTVVIIKLGTHAAHQASGSDQITNPSATGSYNIHFETADDTIDTGEAWVAIVDPVWLTADVNSYFEFAVNGEASGTSGDGISSDISASDSACNFGTLSADTPATCAQTLNARTNAGSGFTVTVEQNHNLLASSGADIDSFLNGSPSAGASWTAPAATNGSEATYGHFGILSSDNAAAGTSSASFFGLTGSSQKTVFSHPNPVSGGTFFGGSTDYDGANQATMLYRVEVSALQEPGHYQNRLMYIGTATF